MSASSPWDADRYEGKHSYVWQFGASLVDLLAPQPGERILDVGCGTGHLTAEIVARGADVVGIDSSPDMLGQARQNYPALTFALADVTTVQFPERFDAVFSNAVLHWVKDAEGAVSSMAAALRPGGRFVAEFGGKGNIAVIRTALRQVLGDAVDEGCPWTFPSIGDYSSLLEKHGLEVREAWLFDRPTPVEGENAMEDWLQMFARSYFEGLSPAAVKQKMAEVVARLHPALYRNGVWTLDYRRLRVAAIRR
ncbi:MAG TPA: methyltransferase domain-containing protein [Bryobacteraceae bacterium]|nr:methyltransferase domain-containing protein [Bryobacteraceae bacterium]